jgi:WD40 repeat-containing protein SMU1
MSQEGSTILCCAFSRDSDHIATGSQNGQIKVWQLSTGLCLRKFPQAHPQGVTSVTFARDGTQVLSTSFDQTARIHGLKSGKTLKEFRGHTSYVNTAIYSKSVSNNILTASSDGTIKLWDARSTECLLTFRPSSSAAPASFGGTARKETTVHTLQLMPNNPEQIFVATKSPQAYIMTLHGQVVRSFSSGKTTGGDFTCATVSPQGKWLYCMGEDGIMYIFEVKTGQLENVLQVSGTIDPSGSIVVSSSHLPQDVVNIVHHPHRNLVATVSDKGVVKLWKP